MNPPHWSADESDATHSSFSIIKPAKRKKPKTEKQEGRAKKSDIKWKRTAI